LLTGVVVSEQFTQRVADHVVVIHDQDLGHDGPPTLLTKGVPWANNDIETSSLKVQLPP
jgi:hypothetical protein